MIAQGRRLVTRPSAVYAPCAVMVRISFIVMALQQARFASPVFPCLFKHLMTCGRSGGG